jgi:hypothetical protein
MTCDSCRVTSTALARTRWLAFDAVFSSVSPFHDPHISGYLTGGFGDGPKSRIGENPESIGAMSFVPNITVLQRRCPNVKATMCNQLEVDRKTQVVDLKE